ncbi:hypothetical protein ACKXTH_000151 [Neisseria gonorrhoeae]
MHKVGNQSQYGYAGSTFGQEYELSQNNGSIANKAVLPISSSNLIQDSMLSL